MQNVNSNVSLLNANYSHAIMMNSYGARDYFIIEKHLSILPILLTIFGTLGNTMAFYVLTRKKLRVQSTMLYFASLTLMDTLSLYQWNFNFFYKYQINEHAENLENQSIFLCRYISFMANFSVQSSAWILAVITIDRYLIVTNTYWKQKFSKNIRFNLAIIAFIIAFFALTNLPVTFLNGQVKQKNNKTRVECYNTNFYIVWQKIVVLIDCVFPLALMIIFNGLLICKTYKSSVKLDTQQKNNHRPSSFLPDSYSCADLTQQQQQPKQVQNFSYYFEPFASLNKAKSKNLFQHYCSMTILPDDMNNSSNTATKSVPNSPNLNPKSRRFSEVYQDKISMTSLSPKTRYLTTETTNIINNNNLSVRSNNNLAISSECNLSRSMISLNERPTSATRNRKILLMLTLLTLSFMVSTLPASVFYAFFRTSLSDKPYRRLLSLIFNCIRHLSHAFNFVIYFTSSSIIKQQLKEIIRDLKRKKLVKFLKKKFSCLMLDAGVSAANGSTMRKTNTPQPGDELEDTSVFLNNSKSNRMSDAKKESPNDEFLEFKITKMNDFNVNNEKSSLKDEVNYLISNTNENDNNTNKINNQVEFESISFKVPVIKKVNRR